VTGARSNENSIPALVGKSERMQHFLSLVERVAASEAPVLVCGETGTGKELVAEALHRGSARAERPFVVCDLGAVAPSLIENELFGHRRGAFTSAERDHLGAFTRAQGGTIFLDEIGELADFCQPRLLRAIERREIKQVGGEAMRTVDVRVIAATHRDLASDVATGRFRSDLFHRLAGVCVAIPPLRERREDVPMLVEGILQDLAASQGSEPASVTEEAMNFLCHYEWPGNVRELKNVLQRAVSVAPDPRLLDLAEIQGPPSRRSGVYPAQRPCLPFKEAKERVVDEWENGYLRGLLDSAAGNLTLAAENAGMARGHLYRLMRKHGLSR
jgi:two-component system nitrogen regulation response regulator GlnG